MRSPKPLFQIRNSSASRAGVQAISENAPKVLVVEDDLSTATAIAVNLELNGFTPYHCKDGSHAVAFADKLSPKAIILDMGLPDITGREVLQALKASPRTRDIKVLIWTAGRHEGLESACLKEGADDYLVKSTHDIGAIPIRLKRMLGLQQQSEKASRIGPITVNFATREIQVDGLGSVHLTRLEYELLIYLMERVSSVVPWERLEREVWQAPGDGVQAHRAMRSVAVIYGRLRKKLGRSAGACIVVHRGVGLQFSPEQLKTK